MDWVFSSMANFTTHLLFGLMEMEMDFHCPRCKMAEQQMAVTALISILKDTHNM
jgi:hypothetical protein